MFETAAAFYPSFQIETFLSPTQLDCYKARAKAARTRYPWSDALMPVFNACLVHTSANVPGKVAYFASIPNMISNRLTRTSPEMFLERRLALAPPDIQTAWATEVLNQLLPEILFIDNQDANGWEHIYSVGPDSCMQGSGLVRQYAHPKNHLALAYQVKDGTIVHRTIVNQKTKTYLRAYGHHDIAFFVAALQKLGYSQSYETLKDETVHLRWAPCHRCNYEILVGPYLDGNIQGIKKLDRKEGVIHVQGRSEFYYGEEPYCGCENSDNSYDDDDE